MKKIIAWFRHLVRRLLGKSNTPTSTPEKRLTAVDQERQRADQAEARRKLGGLISLGFKCHGCQEVFQVLRVPAKVYQAQRPGFDSRVKAAKDKHHAACPRRPILPEPVELKVLAGEKA